jgi:hypothetical protein
MVPTEFSSSIGLVNTKKYQPNTNQKYQIGIHQSGPGKKNER